MTPVLKMALGWAQPSIRKLWSSSGVQRHHASPCRLALWIQAAWCWHVFDVPTQVLGRNGNCSSLPGFCCPFYSCPAKWCARDELPRNVFFFFFLNEKPCSQEPKKRFLGTWRIVGEARKMGLQAGTRWMDSWGRVMAADTR